MNQEILQNQISIVKIIKKSFLILTAISGLNVFGQDCNECEWMIEKSSGSRVLWKSIGDRYGWADKYTRTGSYDEFCCKEYKRALKAEGDCLAKGAKVNADGFPVKEWYCPSAKIRKAESKDGLKVVTYYNNGKIESKKNFNPAKTEYYYVEFNEDGSLLAKGKYIVSSNFYDWKDGEWFEDGKTNTYVKGKPKSEIDKENARLDDIQKNLETSREIGVRNEFYQCYTLTDFESFVNTNPTSDLVPQAKEKINEFIRSEYTTIMSLKNATYATDVDELVTRGASFLKDTRNNSFLNLKDNRQKLVNLVQVAKAKLPELKYSNCIEASNKDACNQFLSLNTNEADKIEKVKIKLAEIEAKNAIELKNKEHEEKIRLYKTGLFIIDSEKKVKKEAVLTFSSNKIKDGTPYYTDGNSYDDYTFKGFKYDDIISEMRLKFGEFPKGCQIQRQLYRFKYTDVKYTVNNYIPEEIAFRKNDVGGDYNLVLRYKNGKLVKLEFFYFGGYNEPSYTQKWDENGILKE